MTETNEVDWDIGEPRKIRLYKPFRKCRICKKRLSQHNRSTKCFCHGSAIDSKCKKCGKKFVFYTNHNVSYREICNSCKYKSRRKRRGVKR